VLTLITECGYPNLLRAYLPAHQAIDEWHKLRCCFDGLAKTLTIQGVSRSNTGEILVCSEECNAAETEKDSSTVQQLRIRLEQSRFRFHELDVINSVDDELVKKTVQIAIDQGVPASSVTGARARAALVKSHCHVGRAVRILKDPSYHAPRSETPPTAKMKSVMRLYAVGTDGSDFQFLFALPDQQKLFGISRLLIGCGCVESWEGDTIIEGEARSLVLSSEEGRGEADVGDIAVLCRRNSRTHDGGPKRTELGAEHTEEGSTPLGGHQDMSKVALRESSGQKLESVHDLPGLGSLIILPGLGSIDTPLGVSDTPLGVSTRHILVSSKGAEESGHRL